MTGHVTNLDIKRILVLDDDVDLAETLKSLLESRNYLVTTASDGVEGLKEIMALDFDVVLCDMVMPSMPGDMFYLAVSRVKPELCERFVFITAHYQNPKVMEFLGKLPNQTLFKPVLTDDIVQAISLVLHQNGQKQKLEIA